MKKILACLIIAGIFVSSASALTWSEAVSLAEQDSNELISARKKLESAEWSYKRSYSSFLPQVSGSVSLSESGSPSDKSYSYGLSASQSLFQGMAGIYGIQSAYTDLQYTEASLRSTRASVLYELRSAFIEVATAQENVKLSEQILKQRQDNTCLIQLRYDSGKEDKGNLMGTKADEAQAKYDLASAKRELKLARLKLSQLLQRDIDEVQAELSLKQPEEQDITGLVSAAPAYVMAKKQLESAQLAQQATISEFLPSVSLRGSYSKSGSDWPPTSSSKSWSLSVSLPIFPGGSNIADRAIYGAKLAQAEEDFKLAVKDLEYSLLETLEEFNSALEALEVRRISLAAAKERAEISRVKYLNGLTTYEFWEQIENAYIQAQKSLLTSQRSAVLAEALWYKSYGGYVK
ncbi:MAG: TolC family protein [Candidatus Saganbacteria bacterium]|nr:TolC family protein [Candidatus Saganbacteria bacterium]